MDRFFLFLMAISPALAIVLYFVFLQQQKLDVKINKQILQQKIEANEFEADFARAEADFTEDSSNKKYYLKKAEKYNNKNKKIEEEQIKKVEKLKKLNKKTEKILNDIEKDFQNFDENDKEFNEKEFNF